MQGQLDDMRLTLTLIQTQLQTLTTTAEELRDAIQTQSNNQHNAAAELRDAIQTQSNQQNATLEIQNATGEIRSWMRYFEASGWGSGWSSHPGSSNP